MNDLLDKMAWQARDDASLFASLIEQQCERQGITWDELADQLQIERVQLSKLALCRRPRGNQLAQDLTQIATYVGVDKANLVQFAKQAGYPVRVNTAKQKRPFPTIFLDAFRKRRTIAFSMVAVVVLMLAAFAFAQSGPSAASPEATLVVSAGQAVVTQTRNSLLVFPKEGTLTLASGEVLAVRAGDRIELAKDAAG
ncbi:MAG: hypothetical protein KC415_17660, partial [Anaerolineales bacterium]|nr:hypothetical protein [Anaerolineales bacterium]